MVPGEDSGLDSEDSAMELAPANVIHHQALGSEETKFPSHVMHF